MFNKQTNTTKQSILKRIDASVQLLQIGPFAQVISTLNMKILGPSDQLKNREILVLSCEVDEMKISVA